MSPSPQSMHKWKVPIIELVLPYITKRKTSPAIVARKLGLQQAAVSMCMINLERKRILKREPCTCGRGFVYWRKSDKDE